MKKSTKSWIIAGLLTLATFLATIYSIVAYHDSVMIVGIMCLLFLGSAFWLFLCINSMLEAHNSRDDKSVGEEQRERMNYEGMKLQGEEMLRLMNSLGKGTYISTKRSAEHLNALLEQYSESRTTTEKLLQTLIEEQTKAAKMQIKYNQNDTGKMIAALNEQCARMDTDFDRCINAIQTQTASGSSQNNEVVSESLHTLTVELAHINSSIQALQIQLNSMPQQPAYAYVPPMPQMAAAPAPQPYMVPVTEEMPAPQPEPEPIMEEAPAPQPEPEPIMEEAPAPQPEPEPIVEEAPAPQPEPEPIMEEAPAPQPEPEPIMEETPAPAAPANDMGMMDQAMIDAMLAAAAPVANEPTIPEPEPIVEEVKASEPTPAPAAPANDMGMMDQAMIDAMLAAASSPKANEPTVPEPEPVVEQAPAADTSALMSGDPNKQLSPDEIAALFAAMG
ncbi:MAG: hypothetical protein IJ079_09490 [Lachnospiraceae bacterium]|nr:hypothetical protein [Lachnospiraceae bacterium]